MPAGELTIAEHDSLLTVAGKDFAVSFSRLTGTMLSLRYDDTELLAQGAGLPGPVLSAFRAPTDNDKYLRKPWVAAGLDRLQAKVEEFAVERVGCQVQVRAKLLHTGAPGKGFVHRVTYHIFANRWIWVENHIEPFGELPILPRLGVRLLIRSPFERIEWYGRGPHENYPDRKASADVGRYRSTVREQYEPYVRPQEMGNREEVRWVALTDSSGFGLLVVADRPLSMSALHFTAHDLDRAEHIHELRPRPEVVLCLDYAQCGLGNASCGPGVLDKYALKAAPASFSFTLRPYAPQMGDMAEVARMRLR